MKAFTHAVSFNRNPVTSNRKLLKFARNTFWSLALPVLMTLLALVLAKLGQNPLFIGIDARATSTNIMTFIRSITCTIIAAMALNANLNSGRMDFSLGATGILAAVISGFILGPDTATTVSGLVSYMLLTMVIGMIIGLINSFIFIFLKLPPIVMSLGMCLVFEGITKIILINNGITKNSFDLSVSSVTSNFFLEPIVIIPILAIVVIFMMLALCNSKWGYDKNALVWDQKISVDTGIKEIPNCIVCFIIAGALIGLYTVMQACDNNGVAVKVDLGSSGEVFKNFLPIFIGGILAKYTNQIIGLLLAVFSTTMLTTGMDAANTIGFTADVQSLITGFSVFGVLVYMVDKQRFIDWIKKLKYVHTLKRLRLKN